jgi:hypothetical protein
MVSTQEDSPEDSGFDKIHISVATSKSAFSAPNDAGHDMVGDSHCATSKELVEERDENNDSECSDDDSNEMSYLVKLFDPTIPKVESWEEDWDTDSEEE